MSGFSTETWRPAIRFLQRNYVFIVILMAAPLMVQFVSIAKTHLSDQHDISESIGNASWIFSIGGGTITTLQRGLDSDLIASFFAFDYMWVFAFFTYFLPMLLIVKADRHTLRNYTLAIAINYAVLIPFYLAFPVAVSSLAPGAGVEPVLYSTPYWGKMATSVDSLTNCFPSGHVSLSFTAFLLFAFAGMQYRRLSHLLGGIALSVAVAVLYLGIHYPADVIGGLALAAGAVAISRSDTVWSAIDKVLQTLSKETDP